MDAGENALIPSTGYNYSTAAPAIASYKFNPRSFNLANADYNYVDRTATIISTGLRSADSNWVEIEGAPVKNAADGTVNFAPPPERMTPNPHRAKETSSLWKRR